MSECNDQENASSNELNVSLWLIFGLILLFYVEVQLLTNSNQGEPEANDCHQMTSIDPLGDVDDLHIFDRVGHSEKYFERNILI